MRCIIYHYEIEDQSAAEALNYRPPAVCTATRAHSLATAPTSYHHAKRVDRLGSRLDPRLQSSRHQRRVAAAAAAAVVVGKASSGRRAFTWRTPARSKGSARETEVERGGVRELPCSPHSLVLQEQSRRLLTRGRYLGTRETCQGSSHLLRPLCSREVVGRRTPPRERELEIMNFD